ncbi:hypothetical protein EMN47_07905 [Prolixibacteraceae bacterium JC049]|jgi:substrate import-associated zinc metallohydrolase lipoprotein|nr:hypothetical protein [Prolixibacteraceae bacterium JC049]
MKLIKYFIFACCATLFFACDSDDDLGESNITINVQRNEIDQWILDNLTKPYNIEVKYKWDDSELPNDKVLTPPSMDKVIPFLEVLKNVWIESYEQAGGGTFVRKYVPKQIILVGSKSFNDNGTITQGTAEGGRKVVLYQINEFKKSDKEFLKRLFHVMHHEFGHILHQQVLYPDEYKMITPAGYTAAWMNVSLQDALNEGFITPYAKNIIDDDWVEMIATMLTNSKAEYDAIVAQASANGQKIIREKESYLAAYFDQVWNIDIYALQTDIHNRISQQ